MTSSREYNQMCEVLTNFADTGKINLREITDTFPIGASEMLLTAVEGIPDPVTGLSAINLVGFLNFLRRSAKIQSHCDLIVAANNVGTEEMQKRISQVSEKGRIFHLEFMSNLSVTQMVDLLTIVKSLGNRSDRSIQSVVMLVEIISCPDTEFLKLFTPEELSLSMEQ